MNNNNDTGKGLVFFLYPALYKITGLPVGLAMLTAVLREKGFDVDIFDTARFNVLEKEDGDTLRENRLASKKVVNSAEFFHPIKSDVCEEMLKQLGKRKPLFVGVSTEEANFPIACKLATCMKSVVPDVPIVAGGVFPTLAPLSIMASGPFDAVCVGEGETAVIELASKLSEGLPVDDIPGIWTKQPEGKIKEMQPTPMHDVESLPFPDFTRFGEHLFYKQMQGRLYKMMNITSSRGCPYDCAYCAAPALKKFAAHHKLGPYFRNMSMAHVIEQINSQIKKHAPEFIYFSSETFLAISDKEFNTFIDGYSKIRIPFWFQTRIETITRERIRALSDVGLFWMTIGIEHGNEKFRRKTLKKTYTNAQALETIKILAEFGVGASLNNMMGFPEENRELVFDTIRLNRQMHSINPKLEFNVWMFTPYVGSEIYKKSIESGLFKEEGLMTSTECDVQSALDLPGDFKKELKGLMRTFNLYVRLPENLFTEIKQAEEDNEKGDEIYRRLSLIDSNS